MKTKTILLVILTAISSIAVIINACNTSRQKQTTTYNTATEEAIPTGPFQNSRGIVPSKTQYNGPLFQLSHNYPDSAIPPASMPWRQALGGKPISAENAVKYVEALKAYVAPSITNFLYNRGKWNAEKEGWYQEPWTGYKRESILGVYLGTAFDSGTFTGLTKYMRTYVITFYDKTAAATLGKIWGKTGEKPMVGNNNAQFAEGSVIVKFAFSTANAPDWDVMQDALIMPVYDTAVAFKDQRYKVRRVSFFQFDIIVKDRITSPKTGWVFSTLVYDKNAAGKTTWDKMVPLGAQWGNDPDINSTLNPNAPLKETVINPAAPFYSKQTLGWGGRISGPNDAAVLPLAKDDSHTYKNLQASSCMSCHSTAQYQLLSNLLPGPIHQPSDTFMVFKPGGKEWLRWFRDNPGNVPFDNGQTALDYDMVTAFQSIPGWERAHKGKAAMESINEIERFRLRPNKMYNGR